MVNKFILIEKKSKLQIIKINNPKKKNALNRQAYIEITNALNEAAKDDSISIVAITGVGNFYSSGNDVSSFMEYNDLNEGATTIKNVIQAFYNFPKVLIAVVNGPCIGIAATTAALCDVIYCSEMAYFHTPFTKLGLCAEGCSSYTYPLILGKSKASEMLLLNHKLSAQEALKFNFVSRIYKPEFENKIWNQLIEFSKLPPQSMKVGKSLIRKWNKSILDQVIEAELIALNERWSSEEFMESISNFLSKKSKL